MGDDLNLMIEAADRRGRDVLARGELAVAAAFDARSRSLRIELANGAAVEIPVTEIQGLADAEAQACAEVEVSGIGYGLHWPRLDLDLSVPGLLAEVFGTRAWLDRQRASRAGSARSEAKASAARLNGRKGGRPRKSDVAEAEKSGKRMR